MLIKTLAMDKKEMKESARDILKSSLSPELAAKELEGKGLTDVKINYRDGGWRGSAKHQGEEINF